MKVLAPQDYWSIDTAQRVSGGPDGPAEWSICCQYAVVVVWFDHLVIDSAVR